MSGQIIINAILCWLFGHKPEHLWRHGILISEHEIVCSRCGKQIRYPDVMIYSKRLGAWVADKEAEKQLIRYFKEKGPVWRERIIREALSMAYKEELTVPKSARRK